MLTFWVLTGLLFSVSFTATGRQTPVPDKIQPGVYLVVGVFANQANAEHFSQQIVESGFPANYGYYPITHYYYVYIRASDSIAEVKKACNALRKEVRFSDAWIFKARPTDQPSELQSTSGSGSENEVTEIADSTASSMISGSKEVTLQSVQEIYEESHHDDSPSLLYLKFNTFHAMTQESVVALVKVVDGIRSKRITEIPTGHTQEINREEILDSTLQITPYALGYRKVQFELLVDNAFRNSSKSSSENTPQQLSTWQGDTLIMNLPLPRLKKGDIQVMFNTYFHGNSSVMRERSRFELEELVKLLKESPNMRIKLHGHTNGAGRGPVYVFYEEEQNFFEIHRSREYKKNGVGSSKLSALRAETIKSYLVHRGIFAHRIETQGWGGKKLLYDPDSPLAKSNIRVEIEILQE